MLAKQNDTLDYANKTMNRFFSTREERLQYEAAFRYECDRASLLEEGQRLGMEKGLELGLEQGIELGQQQGLEQGLEQGKIEVARNMLACKLPVSEIASLTGLSEEVILRL